MKAFKTNLIFLGILSVFFLSACGDDVEGRISINDSAPAQVTNVNTAAGPGEVYLTWTGPNDPSFMYTKIEYTNSKGLAKYLLVAHDKSEADGTYKATVSGFANTDAVTFALYACSVRGNNKGALEVTANPGTPAFAAVAESISIEPDYGGVNVSWTNESVAAVNIVLNYQAKGDASKAGSYRFKVGAGTSGTRFVPLSIGTAEYLSGQACTINVTTEDDDENASRVIPFEKTPTAINKIDRAAWTFPGFQDTNDATIGYSSQEAGGEGASPNGRVIALIDGNLGSFWHTAWKTASAYPHFVIIDMGADAEVSNIDIRRRTGNGGTHKGQTFATCSDAGAADKSDPSSWQWQEQGWFSFDPLTDDTQMYRLKNPAPARYVRVSFAESDKGSSNYVMISEINVYQINK